MKLLTKNKSGDTVFFNQSGYEKGLLLADILG